METRQRRFSAASNCSGTDTAEVTVASGGIVEAVDVIRNVVKYQLSIPKDLLLDAFLLEAAEETLATAWSQQLPFRLMLGCRRWLRQNRRQASLPNCVP
jgi:hypothetical protein